MSGSGVRGKDDATGRREGDRVVRGGAPARRALAARRVGARAGAVGAAALLLAACTTTTTVSYRPSPEQPRLDLAQGQATLARFVGVECERLRGEGHAAGETRVTVTLDDGGLATEAELAASSGDARIDGIIGAVAAQLTLVSHASGERAATLRAGYRCGDDGGVTATLAPL